MVVASHFSCFLSITINRDLPLIDRGESSIAQRRLYGTTNSSLRIMPPISFGSIKGEQEGRVSKPGGEPV
jgi:hypothetical protein